MSSPLPAKLPLASELFDIQLVADAVIRSSALTEESLDDGDGPAGFVDAGDADLLIRESLAGPARVKGKGSVLIEGDLFAETGTLCRVEVAGDAVIKGNIHNASVTADRIFVTGHVSETHLNAGELIRVGGDLASSRITVGTYDEMRRKIDRCGVLIARAREQSEGIRRRVDHDEKRMDKACRALRVPLDFNVGSVVQHDDGRVSVDLSNFYRSVQGKDGTLDVALGEFFAKGVVGVVARTNRRYLLNYPAREKVFLQLLKSLRELFEVVMARDRLLDDLTRSQAELRSLIAALDDRQPTVAIQGRVAPDLEMEFILPQSIPLAEGGYDFAHKSAVLEAHQGDLPGQFEVITRNASGERRHVSPPDAPDLQSLLLSVRDGQIRWHHIDAMEMQHT